jgi:hypothetical protein
MTLRNTLLWRLRPYTMREGPGGRYDFNARNWARWLRR